MMVSLLIRASKPLQASRMPQTKGVYLVGGSVRDHILKRTSNDCDIVISGNVMAFAQKVAAGYGRRVVEIGKGDKTIYRVVAGNQVYDFSSMKGASIEEDLKRRDFTINAMGYDLQSERLIDPLGGGRDLESKTIRLVSNDALNSDPLRMLRAFRFAAELGFSLAPETMAAISERNLLIMQPAKERISEELFKIMAVERSFPQLSQVFEVGLLTRIIPELEPCSGCLQNDIHGMDVFEHTMATYEHIEEVLVDYARFWPNFSDEIADYLNTDRHKVLLKWAALLHDVGKPKTRSVDSSGKTRFIGHEKESVLIVQNICSRLKMSGQHRYYIALIVGGHLRCLQLFNESKRGNLTSKGIIRFVKKYEDHIIGFLIHSLSDQRAKGGVTYESVCELVDFFKRILVVYFSDLKPKMQMPRLITGHDLVECFGLQQSEIIGRLLQKVEEARLVGQVKTKHEAIKLAGKLIDMEGDAGIEPAAPSSGG